MVFIVLGVLLLALKLAGLNPVAEWSWLAVLSPFALAVVWWLWSDVSGRTQRRAMRKDEARKLERRRQLADGMGLRGLFDRSVSAKLRKAEAKEQAKRQRQIDKIEGERERQRQANRDSILTTRMDSKFDSRFDGPAPGAAAPTDKSGNAAAP
jgi:small Trp-rich protein